MSLSPKIYFYIFCMLVGKPIVAQSFFDKIRDLFSYEISNNKLDSINKKIKGSLQAQQIRFVLPNKLEVTDLEILDAQGAKVLSSPKILATISLLSLLSNNIRITNAYVEAPFFDYKIKNSVHNIINLFEAKVKSRQRKKSKLRVSIEHVKISNGRFAMAHDAPVKIVANNINALGKFWVEDGPFGIDISQIDISQGMIQVASMDLPITNLKAQDLYISHEKVATNNLSAYYEQAKVSGSGTVFISKDYYDLLAHINAPKNTYPKGLKPLPFEPPSFDADVRLAGPLTHPEIQVQARTGFSVFKGIAINQGTIAAAINQDRVLVESSKFSIGQNGTLNANGIFDIKRDSFSFESVQKNIKSSELLKFLSLEYKAQGNLNARTSISGSTRPHAPNFRISTVGQLNKGSIDDLRLASRTNFEVDADYVLDSKVSIRRLKVSDPQGLRLSSSGLIKLSKTGAFNFDLAGSSLRAYWPTLPPGLESENFQSKGSFGWHDNKIHASGVFKSKKIDFRGYEAQNAEFDFELKENLLVAQKLRAHLYDGVLSGELRLINLNKNTQIISQIKLDNLGLPGLAKNLKLPEILGRVNGTVQLSGALNSPEALFSAQFSELVIDKVAVPLTQVEGSFANDLLKVSRLNATGVSGSVMAQDLSMHMKSGRLNGSLYLADCSLSGWLSEYFSGLEGYLSGPLYISGTRASPHIIGPLSAKNIKYLGSQMGSGPLSLSLRREHLIGYLGPEDLVLSLSSILEEKSARSSFQFAMGLNKRTINAHGEMNNFAFDSVNIFDKKFKTGVKGVLDAEITAQGYLDKLSLEAAITAHRYVFFDPAIRGGGANAKKDHGPATIALKMENGLLDLNGVASLGQQKEGVSFNLHGPCDLHSCDLEVMGSIEHDHLEDIFLGLRKELTSVSALASVMGKISKHEKSDWSYELQVELQRLFASLPAIPRIELEEPVVVFLHNQGIILKDDVNFSFSPGKLRVGGSMSEDKVNLELNGSIPLILLRLVAPIVQRANGLARGALKVTGSLLAPVFDGHVAPEPGAEVTFNKWFESLEVKEGEIIFKKTSPRSFRSEFRNIKLNLGDGKISIDGSVDKNQSLFDLRVEGSNIVLKNQGQYIEADLNLNTTQDDSGNSVLKGSVIVTDGQAHRQFDLRNFEALAQTSNTESSPKFLNSLIFNIDLDIAIRHFTASARMINIDIETILAGQLKAKGPLNAPKFSGSLAVSEGKITFPATTFDLYESRIDLDEDAESFKPHISIVSSQDFEKDEYPLLQRDTTVQLSLKGDLDRLKLELRPTSGDMKLSQTKIFLMLLMPRGIGSRGNEDIRQSAQKAAMALSGEVLLRPLTKELTELLEYKTKTRFQIGSALEPGGISLRMNWKIGPRIEAQGSYMYIDENYRRLGSEHKSLLSDNYPLGDIKLKLLLFDHKPFGPLFFESSFGASRLTEGDYERRGVFRLSYRVLSK